MSVQLHNLRPNEVVDLVIRRHWIAFVFIAVFAIGGVMLTAIIFALIPSNSMIFFIMTIFWMFYALFLYITWINYELDLFVFTNNRIICIEQKSFLNRNVGETTLDKVQEVSVQTKGLLANLFNFGTLMIITAGSSPAFDMTYAPKPLEHSRYINNLVDTYRDRLYGGGRGSKENKQDQGVSGHVKQVLDGGL